MPGFVEVVGAERIAGVEPQFPAAAGGGAEERLGGGAGAREDGVEAGVGEGALQGLVGGGFPGQHAAERLGVEVGLRHEVGHRRHVGLGGGRLRVASRGPAAAGVVGEVGGGDDVVQAPGPRGGRGPAGDVAGAAALDEGSRAGDRAPGTRRPRQRLGDGDPRAQRPLGPRDGGAARSLDGDELEVVVAVLRQAGDGGLAGVGRAAPGPAGDGAGDAGPEVGRGAVDAGEVRDAVRAVLVDGPGEGDAAGVGVVVAASARPVARARAVASGRAVASAGAAARGRVAVSGAPAASVRARARKGPRPPVRRARESAPAAGESGSAACIECAAPASPGGPSAGAAAVLPVAARSRPAAG